MEERIVTTVCGICDANCGVKLMVKEGRVIKVEGMKEHPGSGGRLCPKGAETLDIAYAPIGWESGLHLFGCGEDLCELCPVFEA